LASLLLGTCVVCIIAVTVCVAVVLSRTRSFEQRIAEAIGSPHLVLGSRIARWKEVLGPPVSTEDGYFFYWPQHGVAVYTSAIYGGQHMAPEDEREVTSILIPFAKQLSSPYSLRPEHTCDMQFEKLLRIEIGNTSLDSDSAKVIRGRYLWRVEPDFPRARESGRCVGLANIPHPLFARCFLEFGERDELISFEIRLCDWLMMLTAN